MKKVFKISLITIGAFILLIIIIGIFAPVENESEQKAEKQKITKPKIEKKKETAQDSIKKIFGAKKADDSGVVSIRYAKPDCTIHYDFFPLGLFKYEEELGVKLMPKIEKLYKKHAEIESASILIRGPFQDKYGNITWEPVVSFEFTRDIFNRINWDRFLEKDLLKVAKNVTWHRRS